MNIIRHGVRPSEPWMGYFECNLCGTVIHVRREDHDKIKHHESYQYSDRDYHTYPCPVCANDIRLNDYLRMSPEAVARVMKEVKTDPRSYYEDR